MHAHLDKARMCTPAINDAPTDTRKQPGFALSVNVIKTAARRATAVLGVLRKRYRALHAILLHPSRGLVRQRVCVAERDVALVGCRRRVELVEQRHQAFPLGLRPAQDGRAAANLRILLLDLRSPSFGNPWSQEGLKGERDEVPI